MAQAQETIGKILTGENGVGSRQSAGGSDPSTVHHPPSAGAEAADAILAHLKNWQDTKPVGEGDYEVRQAANFFAREAYRAAGCKAIRWVYHEADPEECRALDGKTVAIDEPFIAEPLRHHPPRTGDCHCGIVGEKGGEARHAPPFC